MPLCLDFVIVTKVLGGGGFGIVCVAEKVGLFRFLPFVLTDSSYVSFVAVVIIVCLVVPVSFVLSGLCGCLVVVLWLSCGCLVLSCGCLVLPCSCLVWPCFVIILCFVVL
jgi:hypothetical protein